MSIPLRTLLETDALPANWHYRYGVTSDRAAKLCGSARDSNSFLNPHSETALTLFMLGKLDGWFQARSELPVMPRTDAGWNEEFFRAVTRNAEGWHKRSGQDQPLVSWVAEVIRCERENALDAVLVFEFEVWNSALAKEDRLCPVSFLNVSQPWCQFDAVVLLPTQRHLICVESKLASDISRDTSHFPFVSQAIRGWESAFLLTKCQESVFHNWTSTTILLCPRKPFEYRTAYYAYVFNDPADHVAFYRRILEREYAQAIARGRFDALFDEFHEKINGAVKVAHWDDLAQRIEPDTGWISRYLTRLREGCGSDGESAYEAATRRFQLAGIGITHDCG